MNGWESQFNARFGSLDAVRARPPHSIGLSVKVRVASGCFHREHSPEAYAVVDAVVDRRKLAQQGISWEEHESGPELLLWLAVGTAGLALAKESVALVKEAVGLVATIVKARSEGINRGDGPRAPLEIIVRGTNSHGEYKEKCLVTIAPEERLPDLRLEQMIDAAITDLFGDNDSR